MGRAKKGKSYEDLEFTDDFLFCKILQNNPDLCKELTELIIGRRIGKIVSLGNQKQVEITVDGRGVRFDVYMEDDESTVYDIEMQTYREKEIPKRTRYYQSMIDLNMMERQVKFRELKNAYIVFICLKNPFGSVGLHRYDIVSTCIQNPSIPFNDGVYKIILSAEGKEQDVSGDLESFLQYLVTKKAESELTRRLEEKVKESRGHEKWRLEYMTLEERDERMREEGREEGLEKGREEGLEKGREEGHEELRKLMNYLMEKGLNEEIKKMLQDREYMMQLLEKYDLK